MRDGAVGAAGDNRREGHAAGSGLPHEELQLNRHFPLGQARSQIVQYVGKGKVGDSLGLFDQLDFLGGFSGA
jgi:hypothetical protein